MERLAPYAGSEQPYGESEKVARRNRAVLDAALQLASDKGYRNFTRSEVASAAGVSAGIVNWAFETMDKLRDRVMAAAVERGLAQIVAQGLADKHPTAMGAPQALKDSALASLAA